MTLGVHFSITLSRGRARAANRSERDVDRHTICRESADAWVSKDGAPSGPHTPPNETERRDATSMDPGHVVPHAGPDTFPNRKREDRDDRGIHDVKRHRRECCGGDVSTQAYNYYYPLSWGASYVECTVSTMGQGIRTLRAFKHFF